MSAKKPNTSTKGRKPTKRAKKKVAKKAPKKLTDKQKIFCREYIVDLNATQAAIRAGYSEKTAKDIGCQNLAKLNIQTEIAELMENREERLDVSADNVVRELMNIAMSDIGAIFNDDGSIKPLSEIPKDVRKAIAGIDVFEELEGRGKDQELIGFTKKVRLWDKNKALEMLGRHLKMFTDKIQVNEKKELFISEETEDKLMKAAQVAASIKPPPSSNET